MKNNLAEKIKEDLIKYALLDNGDSVLVAVSGGADSVCLLDVLISLQDCFQLKIAVAHVNHMLRGAESDRDEAFVCSLCQAYDIPFYSRKIDVEKLAKEQKISIEEAGRQARYDFFYTLKTKYGMTKIATAHNKCDNAETVCMRFMRGTSVHGLCGIPAKTASGIIRPLLFTDRNEIEAYLSNKNLAYVTDSSNLSDDYTRNKVRHNLIPHIMKEYNENFIDTLCRNIESYCETEDFLKQYTEDIYHRIAISEEYGISIAVASLLSEHVSIAKRVIKKAISVLTNTDVSNVVLQKAYEMLSQESSSLSMCKDLTLYQAYGKLCFVSEAAVAEMTYGIKIEEGNNICNFQDKNVIYVKSSLDPKKFVVRTRMPGDKIYLGKCGHKKVQDLFIDEKVPVFLREKIPVVLYENEIVWVCGVRDNPLFRATPGDTNLKLIYQKEKNHA